MPGFKFAMNTAARKWYELEKQVDYSNIAYVSEFLKDYFEQHGMSGGDLARLLDLSRTMGPKILSGERGLTPEHMRVLGDHFKVEPGVFL